jgi:nucleotide-binding universal stress UspA family protein
MPSFSSILVGTDGSGTASTAVEHAIALAQETGAKLVVVCAFEAASANTAEASQAPGSDAQWLSNPHDVAEEQTIDLIVVGNKGMTAARSELYGRICGPGVTVW